MKQDVMRQAASCHKRRMLIGGAALALLLVLLACGTTGTTVAPPAPPSLTGWLTSEKSQVFLAAGGGTGQEVPVNATRTAAAGDEIWTVRGRGLLKFPDLWVRLYDDTTLRAEDVTPASVKAALAAGAVLVGAAPGVYDRIAFTAGNPPHARITVAGTLFMVAQVRDRPITLVRSFDGGVLVESAVTGARQRAEGSQWVVVSQENAALAVTDEEAIRNLAAELGLWDLFHDIELDAREFGPDRARIPANAVRIVFERGQPAPCPPPTVTLKEPAIQELNVAVFGEALPGCPDVQITKLVWEWGDGTSEASPFPAKHQYARTGRYGIVVTAYDSRGQAGSAKVLVSVSAATESPFDIEIQPPPFNAVIQPPAANLTVRILSAPKEAVCGQKLGDSIQVEVSNAGKADAGTFSVGIYLAADKRRSPNDPLLTGGREFVSGLAAGKAYRVPMRGSNQIPTSIPEGTREYYLIAVADEDNRVAESAEGDNESPPWPILVGCLK